jgi:2'-5' RNA ligase
MPLAVQLGLDPSAAAHFGRLSERIMALLPDAETPVRLGAAPHLSLAIYTDDLDAMRFEAALDSFAVTGLGGFPLDLAAVGAFPGERAVVFAVPVVSPDLLALHRRLHDALTVGNAAAAAACWPHYRPDTWLPHVTLAMHVDGARLGDAVAAAADGWTPVRAHAVSLDLIRFRPVETLRTWTLRRLGSEES